MPNNLVFNGVAEELQVLINGMDEGSVVRSVLIDSTGKLQVDIASTVTVTAEDLDIRDLSGATDSVTVFGTVTVTAEDLDIRDLSGATDSVTVFGTVTVTAEDLDIRNLSGATDSIQLSSRVFSEENITIEGATDSAGILSQNTGEQSQYSYYIFNTGENTVTVQLQISPTTAENYFTNDNGGTVGVEAGGKAVLVASRFLQFTRLFYETSGAACTFEAYYNAQV